MNYVDEIQRTIAKIDPTPLLAFVRACQGTLWLAGNGGSFSTAQHWACDLTKAAGRRAVALGSNPAVLTALANDHGYDRALADELRALGQPGDALLCLSVSGRSPNIVHALGASRRLGVARLILTGQDAPIYADTPAIRVPHTHYGIVEDCHAILGHWLTEALCSQ